MRLLLILPVLLLISCGEPTTADQLTALGVTINGNVLSTAVGPVLSASTTGWAAPLANNSATNDFTLLAQPDWPRTAQAFFSPGWDPSVLVEVCGTDSLGSICESLYPSGARVGSVTPFWTLDSIKKTGVGKSAATVSVGPGPALGLATLHQKVWHLSFDVTQDITSGANAIEPANVLQGAGDPAIVVPTAPDGKHWYTIYVTLDD